MKRFALWLFKTAYRREIAMVRTSYTVVSGLGPDYDFGFDDGARFALDTLHLTKQEK